MAESSSGGNANGVRVGYYKIEKTIGKGNFAVVKLAKNVYTNSEVICLAVYSFLRSCSDRTINKLKLRPQAQCLKFDSTVSLVYILLLPFLWEVNILDGEAKVIQCSQINLLSYCRSEKHANVG